MWKKSICSHSELSEEEEILLERMSYLRKVAVRTEDVQLEKDLNAVEMALLKIRRLLRAFQNSVRGKIFGRGGVVDHLKISRAFVYETLDKLELRAEMFQDPNANPYALLMCSHVRSKVEIILSDTPREETKDGL